MGTSKDHHEKSLRAYPVVLSYGYIFMILKYFVHWLTGIKKKTQKYEGVTDLVFEKNEAKKGNFWRFFS